MMSSKEEGDIRPIIIKKIKKGGGGHHGGAWKVAYADFVTAMMAFFLLLWLLGVSTDEAKNAISNYFDPTNPKVSESSSGAGGLLGGLSMAPQGAMATAVQPVIQPPITAVTPHPSGVQKKATEAEKRKARKKLLAELRAIEKARFKAAEAKLRQAIQSVPELAELSKNLHIDITPEGLRIQIVDQEGKPMFPSGSADMYPHTKKLITLISEVIEKLPNELSIRGHTDSVAYNADATYTNWELSADRAGSTRRALLEAGMEVGRINNVMGKADREPFIKNNPTDPRNRRISIILLHNEVVNPPPLEEEEDDSAESVVPPKPFQKTQGTVAFP